ncbi:DUF1207 domain-containing protein [Alienimonas chondri]|uniref:DUF1207 domain-containing protein n=1 Tax=Alienimonas chondri TaxID=2681879 RepID=A0ABX1VEA7_9PLAN|nr:DUF1207 domain-containing protein [Alienimonas chondri]NNJ26321.1 hypothetical protein [Alienimonas chondri]
MFVPAVRKLTYAALCAAAVCLVAREADAGDLSGPGEDVCSFQFDPDDAVWRVRPLPASLLFKPYMAGVKATRMAGIINAVDGGRTGDVALDGSLGARVGILRFGEGGPEADGWQLDVAAAAFPRLNVSENVDVDATDFRAGVPLSYRSGPTAVSFGYDHISTHIGDEFMVRNPGFQRVNYSRDALLLGLRHALSDDLTVYGEVGYAFARDGGADPWVFQLGTEFYRELSVSTGGPVAAANVQMREECNYGGRFTSLAGWQWREPESGRLLRVAAQYEAGKTPYYELFEEDASSLGFGLFYDF